MERLNRMETEKKFLLETEKKVLSKISEGKNEAYKINNRLQSNNGEELIRYNKSVSQI